MPIVSEFIRKICFIGAPGVGKSTIYKALIEERKQKKWLTPMEAKFEIAKKYWPQGKSNIKDRALNKLFLHNFFFTEKYAGLSNYIMKNIVEESFQSMRSNYEPLFDMAFKGLECEVKDSVSRMLAALFFIKTAKNEMFIDSFAVNEPVLFDDSMWQSLRGVKQYFNNFADNRFITKMPRPDAVIHCFSGIDKVFDQIKKRSNEGKLNTCHYSQTDKELYESIKADIENARYKTELLEGSGIKVLNINAGLNIADNIKIINEFLTVLL